MDTGIVVATAAVIQVIVVTAIGYMTVRLTRQQNKMTERWIRIHLHDKRWEVYDMVDRAIIGILNDKEGRDRNFFDLEDATVRAQFLFGDDVVGHLHLVTSEANSLIKALEGKEENTIGSKEWLEYRHKETSARSWFFDNHEEQNRKFALYLNVSQLGL